MLLVVRVIVLGLLISGTLVFGVLPICIRPYLNSCQCQGYHRKRCATRKQRLGTCFLIFFGGGVLLSTCLVRLLHEVRQGFDEVLGNCSDHDEDNPAFVSPKQDVYKIPRRDSSSARMATASSSHRGRGVDGKIQKRRESGLEKEIFHVVCGRIAKTSFPFPEFVTACGFFLIYFVEEFVKSLIRCCHGFNSRSFDTEDSGDDTKEDSLVLQKVTNISVTELERKSSPIEVAEGERTVFEHVLFKSKDSLSEVLHVKAMKKSVKNINFFYGQSDMKELNLEGMDDFITILALSFNSIFEGFAAGFQHTEISTWLLFVSIAVHKYVYAFVISLETLNKGGSSLRVFLYVLMFSVMSPVGMLAAILTHNNLAETRRFEAAILNSISVGTMLYVTFYEMLKQRKDFAEISGFVQFLIVVLGFIVMTVMEYFYARVE